MGGNRVEVTLRLLRGRNDIKVLAFNANNSASSDPALAFINADYEASRGPQLHALIVGVNKYENSRLELKYPVADAVAVADLIQRKSAGLFEKVNVELLTSQQQTSREAIIRAFEKYRNVEANDVFLFYVASHGTVDGEDLGNQQYFLVPSSVGSISFDALKRTAISQQELKHLVASIPANKKILLLDTCQSGALGQALVGGTTRGLSEDSAIKVLSYAIGSSIISASTAEQLALEGYQGHGIFTAVLLKGLDGAADAKKRGFVSTLDLAGYVEDEVPRLAEEVFKHKQYPTLHNSGQAFPLVKTN